MILHHLGDDRRGSREDQQQQAAARALGSIARSLPAAREESGEGKEEEVKASRGGNGTGRRRPPRGTGGRLGSRGHGILQVPSG